MTIQKNPSPSRLSEEFVSQWEEIQSNTFTRWVRNKLAKENVSFDNIYRDFHDGIKLILFLQLLSGKDLGKFTKSVKNNLQKHENINTALKFLQNENVRLVNIGSQDILDGNKKLILGLIWTLVCHYQLKGFKFGDSDSNKSVIELVSKFVKERLLQTEIDPDRLVDFKNSWNDGVLLSALVNSYIPSVDVVQPDDSKEEKRRKVNFALEEAERKLDVPKIILAEEILTDHVDDKAIITYLANYSQINDENIRFNHIKCEPDGFEKGKESSLTFISKPYLEKGDKVDLIATDSYGNEAKLHVEPNHEFLFDTNLVAHSDFKLDVEINGEPIKEGSYQFKVIGEPENVPISFIDTRKHTNDKSKKSGDYKKSKSSSSDSSSSTDDKSDMDKHGRVSIFNEEPMLSAGIPAKKNYPILVNLIDSTPEISEEGEILLQLGEEPKVSGVRLNPKCYLFDIKADDLGPHRLTLTSEDQTLYDKTVEVCEPSPSAFTYSMLNGLGPYYVNEPIKVMVDYRSTGLDFIEPTYISSGDVEIVEDRFIDGISIFNIVVKNPGKTELLLSKPNSVSFGSIPLEVCEPRPSAIAGGLPTYHFGDEIVANTEAKLDLSKIASLASKNKMFPIVDLSDVPKEYILLSAKKAAPIRLQPNSDDQLVLNVKTPGLYLLSCRAVVDGKEVRAWAEPIIVEEEKALPSKKPANLRVFLNDKPIDEGPLNAEVILLTDPSNRVTFKSVPIKNEGAKYYCDLPFTPLIDGPYMLRLLKGDKELYEGKFFTQPDTGYWWIAVAAGTAAVTVSYALR